MKKGFRRLLTFLLVFSMIAGMGVSIAVTNYQSAKDITITGNSTNNHTSAVYAWLDSSGNMYVAVQSTHMMSSTMILGGSISSSNSVEQAEGEYLSLNGTNVAPNTEVSGNVNNARWTIYKFNKSILESGTKSIFVEGIGGGHDLKGQSILVPGPWTVTFIDWDGTELKEQKVADGGDATPPADPEREGYTFDKWVGNYTNVTKDEIVQATYTKDTVYWTVTFIDWDGTELKEQKVADGGDATPPADPEREGYTFDKWVGNYTNVTKDEIVQATYTKDTVYWTVTFIDWDGTELKEQKVADGGDATPPADPEREGYTFDKWVGNYTNVTKDEIVQATYTKDTVYWTVTFIDWDGTELKEQKVADGGDATPPADPEREGYTFDKWVGNYTNVTKDEIVQATYTKDTVYWTVTFIDWDGTELKEQKVADGGDATPPADPEREGYTFDKWVGNYTNVTKDEIVQATYTKDTVYWTVTFIDWDGTELKEQKVADGGDATPPADPEREGYTFDKWVGNYTNVTKDEIVQATYTKDTVYWTVTFIDWDGTELKEQKVADGGDATPPADPEREGYTFDKWVGNYTNVTKDEIVQATYTKDTVYWTVTFIGWDGTELKEQKVADGGDATPPADPEREGYTFDKWVGNYTNVTKDEIVQATYTKDTVYWTVTFIDWDGTELKEQKVADGGDATPPADPEREGYTFDKWVGNYTNVTKDEIVQATYTKDTVYWTVTFIDWDGTELKEQKVADGGDATPPADPEREGYTFLGWDGNWENVTKDEIITAVYRPNTPPGPGPTEVERFTVTFVDFDGTVIKTQRVNRGNSATPPGNPTRAGWNFREWDGNWTNVRRDETVVARYTELEIEVIEEPPVPEAPPVVVPPVVEVPVEPVPQAPVLPKTGTFGAGEAAGIGALLMAIGLLIRKKKDA
ncbi:InlB B-repeat-containing protein [Gudongella oleilytica]|uniref:InlB B-repeat-containing protein n=1 Tax=Gudongella oleilytica TaxID=1582259 RepID=UPI000FF87ED6|nr:InlB B-repeat-containing protein [Gudongella oleilytica]